MTNERAIEILNPEHREHYPSIEPVNEACRMGMEALEYRTPKKPKVVNRIRGGFRNHTCAECGHTEQKDERYEIKEIYCSVCGKIVDGTFRHYCGNCGQAIDRT